MLLTLVLLFPVFQPLQQPSGNLKYKANACGLPRHKMGNIMVYMNHDMPLVK